MEYKAIVIGSGQGGIPLAVKLSKKGWKTALIEKDHLGGSCVNYGCTPTKTMIANARVANYVKRAGEFGIDVRDYKVKFDEIVKRKNEVVEIWRSGNQKQVDEAENLDLIRGKAEFRGEKEITVESKNFAAEMIFINLGLKPRILDIPGLEDIDILTSRNIMDLPALPEHLVAIGGNYLGLEFGQMFRRFGSKVSVIERKDQIVPKEDEDIAESLRESLEKEGMNFYLGSETKKIEKKDRGFNLTLENKEGKEEIIKGSHLLMAAGRIPNTPDLGLEKTGVETDDKGYIKTNERLETNVKGIYAIGDVKGGPAFTHISYDDHLIIYDNLFGEKKRTINDRLTPYALYTDPELGRVGLTEKAAREKGYKIKVGKVQMKKVARAFEMNETDGLMKIIVNAENNKIIGASILGVEGGELVQSLMFLMMADVPYTLIEHGIFIHPTLTEGFFTLLNNIK